MKVFPERPTDLLNVDKTNQVDFDEVLHPEYSYKCDLDNDMF